jgi:enoyl-CoA hydratase/carnithine racemase
MTYEVTGRVARITFNRPEKGNAIVAATPLNWRPALSAPTSIPTST